MATLRCRVHEESRSLTSSRLASLLVAETMTLQMLFERHRESPGVLLGSKVLVEMQNQRS